MKVYNIIEIYAIMLIKKIYILIKFLDSNNGDFDDMKVE